MLRACTACLSRRRYVDVEEEETAMIAMFIGDLRLARTGGCSAASMRCGSLCLRFE